MKFFQDGSGRHLGFVRTGNSAIRYAVPENLTLEQNMKWIGRPVVEISPLEIFPTWRWPPSWICFFTGQKTQPKYQSTEGESYKGKQPKQENPADADKPSQRKRMQKLLQFDVFRFISPNSISPNFKLPMHSSRPILFCTQFEIRCVPIIKFLVLNYKYLVYTLFS